VKKISRNELKINFPNLPTGWDFSFIVVRQIAIKRHGFLAQAGLTMSIATSSKMVNGSLYYRALESVSIASALSSAVTIYPCQIWVHERWQS